MAQGYNDRLDESSSRKARQKISVVQRQKR